MAGGGFRAEGLARRRLQARVPLWWQEGLRSDPNPLTWERIVPYHPPAARPSCLPTYSLASGHSLPGQRAHVSPGMPVPVYLDFPSLTWPPEQKQLWRLLRPSGGRAGRGHLGRLGSGMRGQAPWGKPEGFLVHFLGAFSHNPPLGGRILLSQGVNIPRTSASLRGPRSWEGAGQKQQQLVCGPLGQRRGLEAEVMGRWPL